MTTENYLIIENNIVTNAIVCDGNTQTWIPPSDSIQLVQSTTPTMNWVWNVDEKNWAIEQQIGTGAVGFTWDGTNLTTNLPEPPPIKENVQPNTTGTQSA